MIRARFCAPEDFTATLCAAPANLGQGALSMTQIATQEAQRHGLTLDAIRGRSRVRNVVYARQAVMLALREAGRSYPWIGAFLKRDHTTVIYGVEAARGRLKSGAAN